MVFKALWKREHKYISFMTGCLYTENISHFSDLVNTSTHIVSNRPFSLFISQFCSVRLIWAKSFLAYNNKPPELHVLSFLYNLKPSHLNCWSGKDESILFLLFLHNLCQGTKFVSNTIDIYMTKLSFVYQICTRAIVEIALFLVPHSYHPNIYRWVKYFPLLLVFLVHDGLLILTIKTNNVL